MEMVFYACQYTNIMKVNVAITFLKKDALAWWLELKFNVKLSVIENVTWDELLEKLKERFSSDDEIHDLER